MTLILGLENSQQAVLVSDRRLLCNGVITDEESNKAAIFMCRDARLAVAFTGIAGQGKFLTRRWLLEALLDSAAPDYLMHSTIYRFQERASKDFGRLHVANPSHKRLSVVLIGYRYNELPPRCYCWLVSNFEGYEGEDGPRIYPEQEFNVKFIRDQRPSESEPRAVLIAGWSRAVRVADIEVLQDLLRQRKPARALVGKGVEAVHAAADSPVAQGFIGKQCTSIVLPSDPRQQVVCQYHTSVGSSKIFGPSLIEAGGKLGSFIIGEPEIEARDRRGKPKTLSVRKVGKNQPCPCKSGKKYKRCHGA